MADIEKVAQWFKTSQNIAVITGAGMSTESGIPDFRSNKGLYEEETESGTPMEEVLSLSFFNTHPETFYRIYHEKLVFNNAEPNTGHLFLKQLEDKGHDVTIITQNIDGLHQKAGSTHVLELHGNARKVITESGAVKPLADAKRDATGLSIDGEWARPAITLYGETLDTDTLADSLKAVKEADMLLVMGTSLNVYPAAGLIYDYNGSKSALINKEPTPLNAEFAYAYTGSIRQWVKELKTFM
ncbi:NAD-dependent protein deacylase [Alkalibacterium kapii]|uniref:protein acetyllysine N-acetyltransferase n=1 Tax=Alkalibacterium kapii TaxID=426704 RepID=A0A511AUM7_9LACT|nr:NAD-dependent protein deacylase [Alkalibacterium kapii]GEK91908.1 NAD-dependent protein deacetylase [Alkalibacterium kapii]